MNRLTLFLVTPTFMLLACDQEARVGDPNDAGAEQDGMLLPEPRTLGEFLERFADTYCDRIEDCCGGLPSAFPSREWCVTSVEEQLGTAADIELPPEFQTTSAACLRAVEATGCTEANDSRVVFDLFLSPEAETACLAAPVPRAGCGDSVCEGACVDDVCIPPVPTGDSCCAEGDSGVFCSNSLCGELDYCDIDGDELCYARRPIGASCVDSGECLSFRCNASTSLCDFATLDSLMCR